MPNALLSIASWDNLSQINNANIPCLNLYSSFSHPLSPFTAVNEWCQLLVAQARNLGVLLDSSLFLTPAHIHFMMKCCEYHPKYTSHLLPSSTLCHLPYKPLLSLGRNSLRISVPGCTSPYDTQNFLLEFKSGDVMLKYFYFHPIPVHPTNASMWYP